ncbi:hypothetical protein RFI_36704 [Reticulomyxa filosa]|uniref:Uncharacterized protein n=1 Tax=Reticulomyxa filosa TaxID=46433 RepID=X6LH75_RETFI|nr:hypothetical protein RFI_36704 [Reticulomyxa filosa]|eukprot:ETO00736.1 hypothetical protein RFI_36704 [Reticulomyxa filosa]
MSTVLNTQCNTKSKQQTTLQKTKISVFNVQFLKKYSKDRYKISRRRKYKTVIFSIQIDEDFKSTTEKIAKTDKEKLIEMNRDEEMNCYSLWDEYQQMDITEEEIIEALRYFIGI